MNLYISTINNVVDYIEQNISKPLTLRNISKEFYLSEFHFSRLFKMLTGISVKQYIIGRKYAAAAERLKNTNVPVSQIARDLGFEYPEVFSRTFKKLLGISPTLYRKEGGTLDLTRKARIVHRDIMNFGGILTLKEDYIYLNGFDLYGRSFEVDEKDHDFSNSLRNAGASVYRDCFEVDDFYAIVKCHGDESGQYTVFFGTKQDTGNDNQTRCIPAGWYARFKYQGDMLDMRTTFNDDFYRWMIVKEIVPCANGIGMINIFNGTNLQDTQILVPVKK